MELSDLLKFGFQNKASDLHLSADLPPGMRIHGEIEFLNIPALTEGEVQNLIFSKMKDQQKKEFEENMECDFSIEVPNLARFRVNVFRDHRGIGAVYRTIPSEVLTLEQLKTPPIFAELMKKEKGLILVTGPTGSGKSTTLAAMIDYYNRNFKGKILTVEDPIEFIHTPKKSIINQREFGNTTKSFAAALKHALRQDPDVILVGEMRDLETISLAITAAETGHLVLGTLHSATAAKTVNRIIDVFPEGEKAMVRTMLSESLEAVISQTLLRTKDGSGRVAAHEIMISSNAIKNLIRENKISQMYSAIQTGMKEGMQTMEQCLDKLTKEGKIHPLELQKLK